jgi:hypothetical protein
VYFSIFIRVSLSLQHRPERDRRTPAGQALADHARHEHGIFIGFPRGHIDIPQSAARSYRRRVGPT